VEGFVEELNARKIVPHVAINGCVSKTGKVRKTSVPVEVAVRRLRGQPALPQADRRDLRLEQDHRRNWLS
jgi:hypothetical protein